MELCGVVGWVLSFLFDWAVLGVARELARPLCLLMTVGVSLCLVETRQVVHYCHVIPRVCCLLVLRGLYLQLGLC